jgi:hypothetical protein
MSPIRSSFLVVALATVALSCAPEAGAGGDEPAVSADGKADGLTDPGALVGIRMASRVGVLLDEVPGADRARVAAAFLAKPASFWEARARMQVEATTYRLTFRDFYYPNKKQLPLPPVEQWRVTTGAPARVAVDGHDLVAADYTFTSTLLTDATSPGKSDKALAKLGGTWDEPFTLPADPEQLFERTGYACMDEEDFPPNSVDSENARTFYDQTCAAGTSSCHVTLPAPTQSCDAALKALVGRVPAKMTFERLPWSAAAAAAVRSGVSVPEAALSVVQGGIDDNRLIYRYIPPDSCAIAEGCVGGSGWRRLLQFTATVKNSGAKPAHIGDVSASSLPVQHNMFEFSACHRHMHFSHYGRFTFEAGGGQFGSKKAFCLESTSRYLNNETTPLTHDYTCQNQGIASGWGDDYIAGIECQWVDVTPLDTSAGPRTGTLAFDANPDRFLCEGTPVLDAAGNFTFEPTAFRTETGAVVDRFQCRETPGWQDDNRGTASVTVPAKGGYVTAPCRRGQLGPTRNCGFAEQDDSLGCEPGKTVQLRCSHPANAPAQTLRVCERSAVLGTGLACTFRDALANVVIDRADTNVTFKCPTARDATEPGGAYAQFTTPVFGEDAPAAVTCVPR